MALSIYQFKPAFQRLLLPLVRRLAVAGVSPNQITLLALLLSVGLGAALWHWPEQQWLWWAFPCWMLLRMALNAADGLLATYSQQQTPLGALLNEMADVLSDVALYLPFLLLPGVSAALVIAFVICALLSEFAGLLAIRIGAPRRFDGPMGKSERAVLFGVLAIGAAPGGAGLEETGVFLNGMLLLGLLLCGWTCLNRLQQALKTAPPTL